MVVIVGLGFDFTNGFHDSANAMATSIATGALKPKVAVGDLGGGESGGGLPVPGGRGHDRQGHRQPGRGDDHGRLRRPGRRRRLERHDLVLRDPVEFVARPDRRSHRRHDRQRRAAAPCIWQGVASKVFIPAVFAPIIAAVVAAAATWLAYRVTTKAKRNVRTTWVSAGGRSAPPPWCPWRTAPTTPKRPWVCSPLALVANGTISKTAEHPGLGDHLLRTGHLAGHLRRWLADHPNPGQGIDRDRVSAGIRGQCDVRRQSFSPRPISVFRCRRPRCVPAPSWAPGWGAPSRSAGSCSGAWW